MKNDRPIRLSDSELEIEVKRLAGCERETTASLISHLAEFDARRLYLGAGFSSLFTYCTTVLRLSEQAVYNRIEAARAVRRFPLVLEMLVEGSLNLTTVRLLAPHLAPGSYEELLAAASHKGKREVEELLADRFPRADVASSVRKLPPTKVVPLAVGGPAIDVAPAVRTAPQAPAPAVSGPEARRPLVQPLARDRYEIRFTTSAKTCEKLRLAQDLLRHAVPNGDPAEIFDRALTALLENLARKKLAATTRPRASRGHPVSSRHTPSEVKRAVSLRDDGRCAFVAKDGRRCGERGFLEFHHVKPYGAGGDATVENIQLRCRAHNAYEAEQYYGLRRAVCGEDVVTAGRAAYARLRKRAARPGASNCTADGGLTNARAPVMVE